MSPAAGSKIVKQEHKHKEQQKKKRTVATPITTTGWLSTSILKGEHPPPLPTGHQQRAKLLLIRVKSPTAAVKSSSPKQNLAQRRGRKKAAGKAPQHCQQQDQKKKSSPAAQPSSPRRPQPTRAQAVTLKVPTAKKPSPPTTKLPVGESVRTGLKPTPVLVATPEPVSSVVPVAQSVSSLESRSSSPSGWGDDMASVFVTSLEDEVLFSCDDFSDDEGQGRVELGRNIIRAGGDSVGTGRNNGEVKNCNSSSKGGVILAQAVAKKCQAISDARCTFDSASRSPATASQQQQQQQHPNLQHQQWHNQARTSSSVSAASSGYCNRQNDAGVEYYKSLLLADASGGGVRFSASSSTKVSFPQERLNNERMAHSVTNPISTWTQEAVEAGASTLLAVLADTENNNSPFFGGVYGRGSDWERAGVEGERWNTRPFLPWSPQLQHISSTSGVVTSSINSSIGNRFLSPAPAPALTAIDSHPRQRRPDAALQLGALYNTSDMTETASFDGTSLRCGASRPYLSSSWPAHA